MKTRLLELSDNALRLSGPQGTLYNEPGFASIDGDTVIFGEQARARYRLHPRNSFNRYWHQLSLEPLPGQNPHFRHYADIAFGQLKQLTSDVDEADLILVLPGHYSREQTALTLGLLEHCPVTVSAMADTAVLAAATGQYADQGIYLDMQLHQAVLTETGKDQGHVTRTRVRQIPGAGLLALYEAWAAMITDAFIRQCRFNPTHAAATEQYLHDHLTDWMEAALTNNEVTLDLNHKGTLYQATVLRSDFEQKSRQVFSRIASEMEDLAEHQLLLTEQVAVLPGCSSWLPPHTSMDKGKITAHAFSCLEYISTQSQGSRLLTTLPSARFLAPPVKQVPTNRHLLIGHRTWAIPAGGTVILGDNLAADMGLPAQIMLHCGDPLSLLSCPDGLCINEQPATEGQILNIGDRLNFQDSDLVMQVIEVG